MLDEGGIVESVLEEVGEIIDLIVAQAEARLRAGPRGCVNRVESVGAAPAMGSCGMPALKYCTTSLMFVNEPLWKKVRASLSCRSVKPRNLKASLDLVKVIFPPCPSSIGSCGSISREALRIQRLERVVADPDVEEVLFDELTDSGDVGVVDLLVEHRSAVAGVATGAALCRGG